MIELEGGCLVGTIGERPLAGNDGFGVQPCFGRATGCEAISLRLLECVQGKSPVLRNADCDEVLFVLSGQGQARLDEQPIELAKDDGFYLAPGHELVIENTDAAPLRVLSARCPDPAASERESAVPTTTTSSTPTTPTAPRHASSVAVAAMRARLSEQAVETTGDRWYSVLIGKSQGSRQVTQFIGSIPPGRAPEHFHHYEEVIVILKGHGRMWAGARNTAIEPGSCIFLPRRQPHCVENLGADPLVLMGVFYPAGSPAVRYDT